MFILQLQHQPTKPIPLQYTRMNLQSTSTNTEQLTITATPTLATPNPVMAMLPRDLTVQPYLMAEPKLLHTLLTKTVMQLMLNTKELPNTQKKRLITQLQPQHTTLPQPHQPTSLPQQPLLLLQLLKNKHKMNNYLFIYFICLKC